MPKPLAPEQRYIPGLDGLRTIAVAAVLLYHIGAPGAVGGLLGVGVFFTLSGYLITSNLMRAWDQRHTLGLGTFWLRRFRRLMPAAVLTIIVSLLLTAVFARDKLHEWGMEGLSALFYVNNWHNIFREQSYFDNFGAPSPLSHMWSLSVEEQFYLLWPLALLIMLLVLRHRVAVMLGTLALTAASFAWMWWLATPGTDFTRAYEGTDTRAGGLLLGAALAIWLSARRHAGKSTRPNRQIAAILGAVGLAGIIALMVLVSQDSIFLYRGGLVLLTVATALAIFGVLHPDGLWNRALGWLPLRWLGERSYGIYLWHMPVIAFLPQPWFETHRVLGGLITVVVSVLLAALSWSLIEDPIRRHGVILPFRQWLRSRTAAKEVGGAGTWQLSGRRFPSYFPAVATVILAALLAIGATNVVVNPAGSSNAQRASTQPQQMEVDPESRDIGTAQADGSGAAGQPEMSCTTVVHVGDSTSIGMFSVNQVNNPADVAFTQYQEYGAAEVVDSVFGARSTTEGWEAPDGSASYPSAIDSVTELLRQGRGGADTCWVISTGVNDAANFAAQERIAAMMKLLDGENVLWSTAWTNTNSGYYAQDNMRSFNDALRTALQRYPKLRLFDWAAEAQPEWFAPNDYAHYSPDGNSRRSHRFAAALAQAFPAAKAGQPSEEKILRSGF